MAAENEQLGTCFGWVGFIAGAIGGAQYGCVGMLVAGVVLASIGYWVGYVAERVIVFVAYISACLITIAFNVAVRQAIVHALMGSIQ